MNLSEIIMRLERLDRMPVHDIIDREQRAKELQDLAEALYRLSNRERANR